MDPMGETLGWTAEAIRRARNPEDGPKVSQRELSRRLGLKQPSQVSEWERGLALPEVKSIINVEIALDLEPGSLLTIRNDEWEMLHGDDTSLKMQATRILLGMWDGLDLDQRQEVIDYVERLLGERPKQDTADKRVP